MITRTNLERLGSDIGAAIRGPLRHTAHVRLLAHTGNGPRLLALLREIAGQLAEQRNTLAELSGRVDQMIAELDR